MKTKNIFTLTADSVSMQIMDVTNPDNAKELASHVFDLTGIPTELEDGDNPTKSLAAYGLSRLMQDRCSDLTDGKLADIATSTGEIATARLEGYQAVYDLVLSGQFRARRATAKAGATVDSFFAAGFAAFLQKNGKEVTAEQATVILQGMSADERKAIRAHAEVKASIEEAKKNARDAVKDLDLGALLG